MRKTVGFLVAALISCVVCFAVAGCEHATVEPQPVQPVPSFSDISDDVMTADQLAAKAAREAEEARQAKLADLEAKLDIQMDIRDGLRHGPKGAEYQKYIVLHDTEGNGNGGSVISWWDSNGNRVAAHFVVDKDGTVWQCVPMDEIAHHAGFGDKGHNDYYGVADESRDDKAGTKPIGDWAPDYGMNSWSIGIEMVHVGSSGEGYPEAQLQSLDNLIAYIDTYYGFESEIIDHKAWRSGNSDTSSAFAGYLANYKDHRTHN